MAKRLIYFLVVISIVAIFLVALKMFIFPEKKENPPPVPKVTLRLKWINQVQFSGFYLAREQGLYKDNGLAVEIYPGGPDILPIQLVMSGVNDFGITGADQLILAREKGMPLVAVAVIYKSSPVAIGSLKEKGIVFPKDLENKKVGLVYGRDEETIYRALLKKENVDSNEIEEAPVMAGISQLSTGKIDAQILYEINEPILLEQEGFNVNLIKPRDYGINFYADTLFTTEEMINNHPDVVKAFVAASIAGWEKALENPDEAVTATLKVNSSLDREHQTKFLELSLPLINDGQIGFSEKERWNQMQEILLDQNLLSNPINIDQVFSNNFLP